MVFRKFFGSRWWIHARCLECQGALIPMPVIGGGRYSTVNKIIVKILFWVVEPLHHFGVSHVSYVNHVNHEYAKEK